MNEIDDDLYQIIHVNGTMTHIAGQFFASRNRLYLIGGFNHDQIWTPNYTPDFDFDELHKHVVFIIKLKSDNTLSYKENIASHTRLIAGSIAFVPDRSITFTFGGLRQVKMPSRRLAIKASNKIFAHLWTKDGCDTDFNALKTNSIIYRFQTEKIRFMPDLNAEIPTERFFHTSIWDSEHELVWIFGGGYIDKGSIISTNDLWTWSAQTGLYKKMITKNPPPERIGASMTYVNGKIYLFGGYAVSEALDKKFIHILDIHNIDNLEWKHIEAPKTLAYKVFGAVLIPYHVSKFMDYILIIGGSNVPIYDDIINNTMKDTYIGDNLDPLTIFCFSVQHSSFIEDFLLISHVSNPSYHACAIIRDKLIIAGGVNTFNQKFTYNRKIYNIKIRELLMPKSTAPNNSVLTTVTNHSVIPHFDKDLSAKIYCYIKQEINQVIKKTERTNLLLATFLNHQQDHMPIKRFLLIQGYYASKEIIEARVGSNLSLFFSFPAPLAHDFVIYCYTDIIDTSTSQIGDFLMFHSFIKACYICKLYRLIWFEICLHLPEISIFQFFSLCFTTKPGSDVPLFLDPNLEILKFLAIECMPLYRNKIDAASLENCSIETKEFVLYHLYSEEEEDAEEKEFPKQYPSSTLNSDLACLFTYNYCHAKDGTITIDETAMRFDETIISNTELHVVKAVETCRLDPLFSYNSVDCIISAITLLNTCQIPLTKKEFTHVVESSIDLFYELASENHDFRMKLIDILLDCRFESILEFLIYLIGVNGQTYICGCDDTKIKYDSSLAISLPRNDNKYQIKRHAILWIITELYTKAPLNQLNSFFDKKEIAEDMLTFYLHLPLQLIHLHNPILEFMKTELFSEDSLPSEYLANIFSKCFKVKIHDLYRKYDNLQEVLQVLITKHLEDLDEEEMKWILNVIVPDSKPLKIQESIPESVEKDIVSYYK